MNDGLLCLSAAKKLWLNRTNHVVRAMSIILTSKSDTDGKLHIEIPVGVPGKEFEVEIVVRPGPTAIALPPNYFDLIGAIDDETFVRPPQGVLPPPVSLE